MTSKQIHSTLSALKVELKTIKLTDTETAETINQLINKLEQQMAQPDISEHRNLIDQLRLVVNKFEVSHPKVTSIANDLMVKLVGIGV